MRAREPDLQDHVNHDGLQIGCEVFGEGDLTILLLPTWTIIHSRFWKFQIPYLARRHRVVTYDGPGNGRSPRTTDPSRYAVESHVARSIAVLDATGTDRAVVVGFSDGGKMAAALAAAHPDRTLGVVLIAPSLAVLPSPSERAPMRENFLEPYPPNPEGWEKYNAAYWEDHYDDFLEFFFAEIFSESYTTKAEDDCIEWARETNGAVLKAEMIRPDDPDHFDIVAGLGCPTLVVQGSDDHLIPHDFGSEVARLAGGSLLVMEGNGHAPHIKEPVRFNLALTDFIERLPL